MGCEEARKYVQDFVKDQNIQAGKGQIDEVIDVCCKDIGSQACADARAALAATAVCAAYTDGVCIPCCTVLGNIVGPIAGAAEGIVVGILKGAWDGVKSLFGGGGCNYKPAADGLVQSYGHATEQLAQSVGEAWNTSRMTTMGADYLDGDWPIVRIDGPGGTFVPTFKGDPKAVNWDALQFLQGNPWKAWTYIIVRNAAILSAASTDSKYPNKTYWDYDDGSLYLPGIDKNAPAEKTTNLFSFNWSDWPCGGDGPSEWKKAAKSAMSIRWHFVETAAEHFLRDMMITTTQEIQNAELTSSIANLVQRAAAKRSNEGTSGWTILAILGVLGAAGYGVYRYTKAV